MIESVKHGGRQLFEIGIFGSKIALIILSFVNADASFIMPAVFLENRLC